MPKEIFCGRCRYYQGTEKVSNPKSTAWVDTDRPKCAIDKSTTKQNYHCADYESNEDKDA